MKRGLTLFLVLLAVCFALPAPTAAAEKAVDADLLRDYLQEQFGVTILMGKECSGWSPEEYEFRIIPEGNTPFQRLVIGNRRVTGLLLILFNVLNAFPARRDLGQGDSLRRGSDIRGREPRHHAFPDGRCGEFGPSRDLARDGTPDSRG